jgi:hypothetical protein
MAVKTGIDRYNKWMARFESGSQSASPIMTRLLSTATTPARVSAQFNAIVAMEAAVRAEIDAQGATLILAGQYLNFGRQLWSLMERYTGATAVAEASALRSLWIARGLAQAVLEAIQFNCFGLALA